MAHAYSFMGYLGKTAFWAVFLTSFLSGLAGLAYWFAGLLPLPPHAHAIVIGVVFLVILALIKKRQKDPTILAYTLAALLVGWMLHYQPLDAWLVWPTTTNWGLSSLRATALRVIALADVVVLASLCMVIPNLVTYNPPSRQ